MGIKIDRIYFKNGIPELEEIRIKFKTQTGLSIWVGIDLNLVSLTSNSKEIINRLNDDIDKYDNFQKKNLNVFGEAFLNEIKKINHIISLQFRTNYFSGIDYIIIENTIELEYGFGYSYFPQSLCKILIELGGIFVYKNNKPIEDWTPPKSWKKLKKWSEYKWFNRPRK